MKKIKILIPVFNDWESLSKLLSEINYQIKSFNHEFSIFIINDASTENKEIKIENLENIKSIKIIHKGENGGHTRCIALGLKYIYDYEEFDYVIPMDGDGEDRPQEIRHLIEHAEYSSSDTVVGERVKRSENFIFKFCYNAHKVITLVFAGQNIRFGNFTCLSKTTVEKMINEKATWSSFSGALTKVEKNRSTIPSIRGTRYFGPSKMSFINLIKHSLAIISVFKLQVLIRSILFLIIYSYLMFDHASVITILPLPLVVIMNFTIFNLSKRENMKEFNDALLDISKNEVLK